MIKIDFYEPAFQPEGRILFSVIVTRFNEKWLFVRHRKRVTWEIPGGHVEESETPDEAASRELIEETGASEFTIESVAVYSVMEDGKTGYGKLYYADVKKMNSIPDSSEIGEVIQLDKMPAKLTHPLIQPVLFRKVVEYLGK
ncbi:MAG: NUDIX domain-containing protein [Bacteroidales bacterium]|nr:NUDIX domain-containing protein [Bacteroidales bacterium]